MLLRICPRSTFCSFLPHLGYVFLQDCFLTGTNEEADPKKQLKGVKFSEVAVILDTESEGDEPEDDVF